MNHLLKKHEDGKEFSAFGLVLAKINQLACCGWLHPSIEESKAGSGLDFDFLWVARYCSWAKGVMLTRVCQIAKSQRRIVEGAKRGCWERSSSVVNPG